MRNLESDQAKPIKWVRKWVICTRLSCDCGRIPMTSDPDDERTMDCPECEGAGGEWMEVET